MSLIEPDAPMELGVIAHVSHRIYRLLPVQSGLSLIDVEDDPTIFLNARRALLIIAEADCFDEILDHMIELLDKLNQLDNYLLLKQRNVTSLSSVLIVVRLLADLAEVSWMTKEPSSRKNSMESAFSHTSSTSNLGVGFATVAADYHTVQPSKINSKIVSKAIAIVSKLKSANSLTQQLAAMNGKQLFQSTLYADISTRPLIDQIDYNCEFILKFLAAANPSDFFNFISSKISMLRHNFSNEADFARYSELFSCVYLNEDLLLEYLRQIRVIFNSLKKESYRQLVFSFVLKSANIWIQSRPHEYLNACREDSEVSLEADSFFDEILASSDLGSKNSSGSSHQRQFRSSFKFLAFLLSLNPKFIHQYLENSGASLRSATFKKITTLNVSKKQKVLSNVIKNLSNSNGKDSADNFFVLESLDFISFIACVASSAYQEDPQNITVRFSLAFSDLVSNALVPISSNRPSAFLVNPSSTESTLFNELRLNYFSSLCVLNPQELFPQLMKILVDENSTLENLNIACSILRIYTSIRSSDKSNYHYIVNSLKALRTVMIRVSMLVKSSSYSGSMYEEEDVASLSKSTSSISSESPANLLKSLKIDTQTKKSTNLENFRSPTSSSVSTPKGDKLKDSTKNFFRSHPSSNHSSTQNSSADDSKSLESRDSTHRAAVTSREILVSGFGIFKKFPHYYLRKFDDFPAHVILDWLMANMFELNAPILAALSDSNTKLRIAVRDFIHAFYVTPYVNDELDATISAFTGSSHIAYCIGDYVLNTFSSDSRKKDAFESFIRMLEFRVHLHTTLSQHSFFRDVKQAELPYHNKIASFIEQSLIFCLTTADQETYGLIKRGVRTFRQEFALNDLVNSDGESNIEFLQSLIDERMVTTGSVALHKNIQKHFKKLSKPTTAVRDAFTRIYDKWFKFSKADYSELSSLELTDFRNFASFLASTSGLFVDINAPPQIKEEFVDRVENFIKQQLSMLANENLVTRENAKEILAVETNEKAYPVVMRLFRPYAESLSKKMELTTMDLNVVELLIVLLKAMLDSGSDEVLFLISIDVLESASILASIVDSLQQNDKTTLKLRMRCSSLFYNIAIHREALKIQCAYKIRNMHLRNVFKWFQDAASYDSSSHSSEVGRLGYSAKDLEYLYIDLIVESAKALAALLDSLVLEAPKAVNEHELKFYRSRVFSVYFNTLLKALEKYSDASNFRISIKHKVTTISEHITASLTNLLRSNVDVGLAYAFPIGYHTNLKVRISFLKGFISIMENYSEGAAPDIAERKRVSVTTFKEALGYPAFFSCLGRACPSSEASVVTSSLISLASTFNQSATLVSFMLEDEIKFGTNYTDILRRNSFASRSLSAFGRIKGSDYLKATLRPILTEIRDSEAEFEVEKIDIYDPDAQRNLESFFHYLKKLVNVIVNSIDNLPIEFKKICQTISESVREKFPKYRLIAVGSFIFLRFFCPAIVSPESESIVDIPDRGTQRKFLLLAKVLQNMANGSISSIKWPLVKQREAELFELNDKILNFLERVSSINEKIEFEYREPEAIAESMFTFFHRFFYEYWMDIRIELTKTYTSSDDVAFGNRMSDRIMKVLNIIGQPTITLGYEIPASITPESNSELYEFMSKYSIKDISPFIDSQFVRQDITQEGLQLLVFSHRDFNMINDITDELALYRFIQVASKVWEQKFAFVIDCTGFDCDWSYPRRGLALFSSFVQPQMFKNCVALYYFNVSTEFSKVLDENVEAITSLGGGNCNIHFRSSLDDKKTVINLGLPKATVKSYFDVRVKFTDVSLYQEDDGRFVPVIVKIGHEYLQISQTSPRSVKSPDGKSSVHLTDVFRLDSIKAVEATETTQVSNEITLTISSGRKIILSSAKYLEIMRLLYFTRNRTSNLVDGSTLSERSEKSVEHLLGQLFNVIFLGLTSSSAQIRGISYNLLTVSKNTFDIDLGEELHKLHEIYFPSDNNSFVVRMSERLAEQLPQITFDFIESFFKVYNESFTSRQRLAAVLYVSPWIDNIYEHVFKSDDEHGPDLVAEIIRKFLEVSTLDSCFLSAFNTSFWSKLCLQERMSPILITEIVSSAVDREAEGNDWKNTISLLTATPTIELFSCVIKRLRDISHIPFPDEKGTYSIASHGNWIEITVLVQIAVSLVFNNYVYAEMFLPDLFYIISILVDVGPSDLRIASHQLLLNLLQAFLTNPKLTDESRMTISTAAEQFTTHRARLLFGLNRDNDESLSNDMSKFSDKISTVESLVTLLLATINDTPSFEANKTVWISRWNRYVIDAALRKDSVLRGRALLLLGVLSKQGVNDNMVIKILEMVIDDSAQNVNEPKFNYLAICVVFSLSKVSLGLLPDSELFSRLFWLAITISHSSHTALFQGGIQFVTSTLQAMHTKGKFKGSKVVEILLEDKKIFGSLIENVEDLDGIRLQSNNFDLVLLHFLTKGLQLPSARTKCLECLKSIFQIRYLNEVKRISVDPSATFDSGSLGYLLVLFILLKHNELKALLNEIGIEDEFIYIDEEASLPRILTNFILSGTEQSHLVLVLVSIFFNEGQLNDKSMLRFLQVLKFISKRNHKILINIYYEIQPTIRKLVQTRLSADLITAMFEVASMAYISEGYNDNEIFRKRTNDLLAKYNISGVRSYIFPSEQLLKALAEAGSTEAGSTEATKANRGNIMQPIIRRIFESRMETA
jgi:hypothetical protein